jgi:hypothetical protein
LDRTVRAVTLCPGCLRLLDPRLLLPPAGLCTTCTRLDRLKRDAHRLLVAVYRMSDGTPGAPVARASVFREARRVDLFGMSEEAFEGYQAGTIFRARARRA